MKTPFKNVPAIDKYFRTREFSTKSIESTLNVKRIPEKWMQIGLLAGAWGKALLSQPADSESDDILKVYGRVLRNMVVFLPCEKSEDLFLSTVLYRLN